MNEICLTDLKKGGGFKIIKIDIKEKDLNAQLKNLGFEVGENIKLLNWNFGKKSYLVKVMGVNYAIDKMIAERILGSEWNNFNRESKFGKDHIV